MPLLIDSLQFAAAVAAAAIAAAASEVPSLSVVEREIAMDIAGEVGSFSALGVIQA